jgi:hypothetical protein
VEHPRDLAEAGGAADEQVAGVGMRPAYHDVISRAGLAAVGSCLDEQLYDITSRFTRRLNHGYPAGGRIGGHRRSGYLTSSPVKARPMIMRWISEVPSKIVKIVDYRAVIAGQRPVRRPGISTDSAPAVRGS